MNLEFGRTHFSLEAVERGVGVLVHPLCCFPGFGFMVYDLGIRLWAKVKGFELRV